MLGDKRFLRTFNARNILSFGPESPEIELQSLNALIGPNGAGKSKLIETISVLQAAPGNLLDPIQTGGGISEWLWKGGDSAPTAEIDVTVSPPQGTMPLRHRLELTMVGQRAELADEAIENAHTDNWPREPGLDFYYRYRRGHPVLKRESGNGIWFRPCAPSTSARGSAKRPSGLVAAEGPGPVPGGDIPRERICQDQALSRMESRA
jgi:predicted ATPase